MHHPTLISIDSKLRLLLMSFLLLFVELSLIRWLGSNIVYLSYFSNFVLLGSFLGIGIGFLKVHSKRDLFDFAPIALTLLVALTLTFGTGVDRFNGDTLIYPGGRLSGLPAPVILPLVFIAVAAVMAMIANGTARTFVLFNQLDAYRLDILGSLGGIVTSSLLALFSAPPIVWGAIVVALFVVLYLPKISLLKIAVLAGLLALLSAETLTANTSWSPYYKIQVANSSQSQDIGIYVNGVPFQTIESINDPRLKDPRYSQLFEPYKHEKLPLHDVLVIGAGNGKDVAVALAEGAKHVDAVEIDPKIYELGKQLNPQHPYDDPRVSVFINDGRAFLQQSSKKYDAIFYSATDSITLVLGQSSLRLESYLLTSNAISSIKDHLKPHGFFSSYNYFWERWYVDRIGNTIQQAFSYPPCLDINPQPGQVVAFTITKAPSDLKCSQPWRPAIIPLAAPVSDDHPFPYLRDTTSLSLYAATLPIMLIASLIAIRLFGAKFSSLGSYLDLFFMGAAFLLLETKNIVQFALFFGTTWFVNALVFTGVLLAVYAAVEFSRHFRISRPILLYPVLLITLGCSWLISETWILSLPFGIRFLVASLTAFAPIFVANIIFAERFRTTSSSTTAFATNLFGAMVGGVLEYSALQIGYSNLLILVALLYLTALLFGRKHLGAITI